MNFQSRLAAFHLNVGGVISHPTDTIQSLTCLPRFESSMAKILQLKRRCATKGLILLANDVWHFTDFVAQVSDLKHISNNAVPTTYLLKAKQSSLLTGGFNTVALRLTANPLIANLCRATNSALVSTSANLSGKRSVKCVLDLNLFFGDKLDFIIAPQNHNNKPSKIIDLQTGERFR